MWKGKNVMEVLGQINAGYSGCMKSTKKLSQKADHPGFMKNLKKRLKGSVAT